MDSHELLQLDFLEICTNGDYAHAKSLLRAGTIEANYQHKMNGWSALHWAARREHEDICVLLLDNGFRRDLVTTNGDTPYAVCPTSNAALREILRPEAVDNMNLHIARPERDASFTPGYLKNPTFPYTKKTSSDNEPDSPTKGAYYSYGRRDSATKTRFILVQTSASDGKEAYKRITVPGGSTLNQLRKSVEAALRQGPIEELLILPHRILLEDDSQIGTLDNCQKIAVTFASATNEEDDRQSGRSSASENGSVVSGSGYKASHPTEKAVVSDRYNDKTPSNNKDSQPVQSNETISTDHHISKPEIIEASKQLVPEVLKTQESEKCHATVSTACVPTNIELPIKEGATERNQAANGTNHVDQEIVEDPVQSNETTSADQDIVRPEVSESAQQIIRTVAELKGSDDYRTADAAVATERVYNYVDQPNGEARRDPQNNSNFGWIGWINENAGRQAMAVAVGVSAGALLWKLAVMRK